jgi:hypothetical protein
MQCAINRGGYHTVQGGQKVEFIFGESPGWLATPLRQATASTPEVAVDLRRGHPPKFCD